MKLPKELTTVTPLSKYLAMFLFISLPFIGFLFGIRYQEMVSLIEKQQLYNSLTSINRSPTPTPEKTQTLDTSTWKIYTNKEYGFSFSYPSELIANEGQTSSPLSSFKVGGYSGVLNLEPKGFKSAKKADDPSSYIIIYKTEPGLSVLDSAKKYGYNRLVRGLLPASYYKKTIINGYNAVKVDYEQTAELKKQQDAIFYARREGLPIGYKAIYAYFKKGDFLFEIGSGRLTDVDSKEQFDQILSTFRFTN